VRAWKPRSHDPIRYTGGMQSIILKYLSAGGRCAVHSDARRSKAASLSPPGNSGSNLVAESKSGANPGVILRLL
jgi:hypothetical protein